MRNSAGFSFIDAVLIMAIVTVVGFSISKFIPDSINASIAAQETVDFATTTSLVRRTLSNLSSCNASISTAPSFTTGGQTMGKIFMPNGVTPLLTNGSNLGDGITGVNIQLIDLGSLFIADTFHLGAVQISGTRRGYTGLNAKVTSTKYVLINAAPPGFNCTVNYFTSDPGGGNSPATGVGIGGGWVSLRWGDRLSNNPPADGTVDIAYGTGVTIGPGPYSLNPPAYLAPFAKNATNWQFVPGNGSWSAYAYKVWP